MAHLNFEFKARAGDLRALENRLLAEGPRFAGEDHQVDTYFAVPKGRLKLREGNVENTLIHYLREDGTAAKTSTVSLFQNTPGSALKGVLLSALETLTVVDKKRRIYFIGNVKFHFDTVEDLGTFVEVEAIDIDGTIGMQKLQEQCAHYIALLGILPGDFISHSYSDMLMARKSSTP